jgi:hypothetical protein
VKNLAIALTAAMLALAALAGTVVWGNGPATSTAAGDAIVWGS